MRGVSFQHNIAPTFSYITRLFERRAPFGSQKSGFTASAVCLSSYLISLGLFTSIFTALSLYYYSSILFFVHSHTQYFTIIIQTSST